MENIKTIAILRALQLGDFLCAVPAMRSLRHAFPEAKITWIGLPGTEHLRNRFTHYLDDFIAFPGYPGLPEQPLDPKAVVTFLQQMQTASFDLILQMQGSGAYVNELVSLCAPKYSAGFYKEGHYQPNKDFFIPYPAQLHEVERHLSLMARLGIPLLDADLEFPMVNDRAQGGNFVPSTSPYICIHPGSRGRYRQWDTTHFARVGDFCASNGYAIVITGTAQEMDIVQKVAARMVAIPQIAAGKTDLDAMANLIQNATGFISNCTGVAHIAYALGTPSVVISMDGEPHRWAPPQQGRHCMINWLRNPVYVSVLQAVQHVIITPNNIIKADERP